MKRMMNRAIAVFAVVFVGLLAIGCSKGDDSTDETSTYDNSTDETPTSEDSTDETPTYKTLTSEYQTYYLNIADKDFSGLEGFHLKNLNTDKSVGMVIDKIFACDTMANDEAAVAVFNFDSPETGSNYWGFGAGTIADSCWSSGEITKATDPVDSPEMYITGFATSEFAKHTYVGIVAKNYSDAVFGDDITFVPIISGNPDTTKAKKFSEIFVTK